VLEQGTQFGTLGDDLRIVLQESEFGLLEFSHVLLYRVAMCEQLGTVQR
jgi:hypothetical protein